MKKGQNSGKIKTNELFALLPFFKPYKREVFFAFLALLVTALMVLFFGKVIKYLIDFGFAQEDKNLLNLTLLGFVIAVLTMAIAGYYRSSLINSVAEKVISDLRKKVYNHIILVSAEFFEITKTGDVISRLTVDTSLLYNIISNTISFFLRNSLFFLGGIFLLFFTSAKLSLISLLLIPIAIAPIVILGKKVKILSRKSQESFASVGAHIEESINGIKTIQSCLCESKEQANFAQLVEGSLKTTLEKIRLKSLMVAVVIALAFGGIAIVLWVGSYLVLDQKITSGDLSAFIFYSVITATSLVSLSQIAGQLQSAAAAAKRIFDLLKISSPVQEAPNAQNISLQKNIEISFENAAFSYPSRKDFSVISDFSLKINAGEKIAIVGESGSGKSTILQLLLRFYDVKNGQIMINGVDIKNFSLASLRANFSYISQDCFIFSGTVFDNISYANDSSSRQEIEQLVSRYKAFSFINDLPLKLDNFVGEKGVKLSGGERQRIAIARALIKNSPILLLDEATSALDNQNEKIISDLIEDLAPEKTVITVAHRLSSIIRCDKIVFVEQGKILEVGSHEELIRKGGFYKKMYESQVN